MPLTRPFLKKMKPSLKKFIAEIFHTAEFVTATHNNFAGKSLGNSHQHANIYQISYYLKGRERVIIGRRHYTAKEGNLFFVPPHCMHGAEPSGKPIRFEMLQVKFSLKRPLPSPLPVYISIGYPTDLLFAFHSLVNEFHMQRPQREAIMRLNLAQMVLLIQRQFLLKETGCHISPLKNSKLLEERIAKVICCLQANYAHKLTLAEIARMNGYSASTLSHVFKQHVGISPVKYLINYRLSKALDLIGHTERKLEDIAFETGFKNVYYFSRLFKMRYNQSPRRYAGLIYNSPGVSIQP